MCKTRIAHAFIQPDILFAFTARKEFAAQFGIGGFHGAQEHCADSFSLMIWVDNQLTNEQGITLHKPADGADDCPILNRLENEAVFKLQLNAFQRLQQRGNGEVLQQNCLALKGEVLEGKDGGKVGVSCRDDLHVDLPFQFFFHHQRYSLCIV